MGLGVSSSLITFIVDSRYPSTTLGALFCHRSSNSMLEGVAHGCQAGVAYVRKHSATSNHFCRDVLDARTERQQFVSCDFE